MGRKLLFSAAPQSNARGVAIFFEKKKLDYKIHNQKQDENGNLFLGGGFGVVPTKCFWSRCFVS